MRTAYKILRLLGWFNAAKRSVETGSPKPLAKRWLRKQGFRLVRKAVD